mmetsp:Transcript_9959/g.17638  ORF Transcript_9959/g.17638 Transcript_9959/m.17638 type:complete len:205 (-) Transcript_9959:855-1469(-)
MLSTNREGEVRICLATIECRIFYKPTNSVLVNCFERIFWKEFSFDVLGNEDSSIVTRDSHCHLGQIVCSVREEVAEFLSIGFVNKSSELIRNQSSARHFDHGSNFIWNIYLALFLNPFGSGLNFECLVFEFVNVSNQRNHQARTRVCCGIFFLQVGSCMHDGFDLHGGQTFTNNGQSAPSQTQHGILFVHRFDGLDQLVWILKA